MKIAIVLNQESGTLRDTPIGEYCRFLEDLCQAHDHDAEIVTAGGKQISGELKKAFSAKTNDTVFAAGGDGTISTAAALAWKSGKPLGVIPAGTMNLFARSLKIPLEIEDAARGLVAGQPSMVDIATANGTPFLLQYTVGFHPKMVQRRNREKYASRFGKIRATIVAALDMIRRPPSFSAELSLDGKSSTMKLSSLAVSCNPYGEGHLPYAEGHTAGKLAVYLARPADAATNAKMLADLTLGTWRGNPDIREILATSVVLRIPSAHRRTKAAMDGELIELDEAVEFCIHPKKLPVILPGDI
ncbi:diacylglycerol/lipid kinase family protein [Salaquimonas pukyongi]|uniref:diacylglycerol/lipid kinase family protein n=1 Tax=Salaquimonas pukyongi TaxID=2712698 RepID=UPI00096B8053|nr:diacylglycerol kinase family protein [Salaquimonas pukyongi]